MDIGNQIKKFRTERGYTVNKLANLAGISRATCETLNLGKRIPL